MWRSDREGGGIRQLGVVKLEFEPRTFGFRGFLDLDSEVGEGLWWSWVSLVAF